MTTQSSCPNGRRLWPNGNGSGRSGRRRGSGSPPWKPRCGGDGVRRRPFPGMSRYRAVVRGGGGSVSRPPEEAIQETVEVPLEACPACGGPLEDRATHEPVHRPVITRFRTESGYCRRCRKRVRSRHPRPVSSATGAAEGEGVGGGPEASAGRLSEGGGVVPGGLEVRACARPMSDWRRRRSRSIRSWWRPFGTRWRCTPMRRGGGSGGRGPGCGF
jgi:hypothetical protein